MKNPNQKLAWEFDNLITQIEVFKEKQAKVINDIDNFKENIITNVEEHQAEIETLKKNILFLSGKSVQINQNTRNIVSNEAKANHLISEEVDNSIIILQEEEQLFIHQLVNHYNNVIDKQQDEPSFKSKYNPDRYDVANAMARNSNLNLKPIFEKGPGDYWVIKFLCFNIFLFVPRFHISYQYNIHYVAAMCEIFKVNGYDESMRYNIIRLIKPAIFTFKDNSWELIVKGEIQLSGAEPL